MVKWVVLREIRTEGEVAIVFLKPTMGEAEGMEGVENGFVFLAGDSP